MAGNGGYKHRKRAADRKRSQHKLRAKANLERVRNQFESKGQAWDPANNSAQMAALTHDARRLVALNDYSRV